MKIKLPGNGKNFGVDQIGEIIFPVPSADERERNPAFARRGLKELRIKNLLQLPWLVLVGFGTLWRSARMRQRAQRTFPQAIVPQDSLPSRPAADA